MNGENAKSALPRTFCRMSPCRLKSGFSGVGLVGPDQAQIGVIFAGIDLPELWAWSRGLHAYSLPPHTRYLIPNRFPQTAHRLRSDRHPDRTRLRLLPSASAAAADPAIRT